MEHDPAPGKPEGEVDGDARPGLAQTGHATRTAAAVSPSMPQAERADAARAPEEPGPAKEAHAKDVYVVSLPDLTFEGPLDMLLGIIQKHELDILNLPISFVTKKYLEYLTMMQGLSIDVASEYLVMAATLAYIKSRSLLPDLPKADGAEGEGEEEEDPRMELVRRLLEYQKYKAAAEDLGARDTLGATVFARGTPETAPEGPAPFAAPSVINLLDAFSRVLSRTKAKLSHEVVFDRISISDRISELIDLLRGRRSVPFDELFGGRESVSRFDLVISFLAVLEMCRMKMLRVLQTEPLAPIHVELLVVDEDDDDGDPLRLRTAPPPPSAAAATEPEPENAPEPEAEAENTNAEDVPATDEPHVAQDEEGAPEE